MLNKIDVLSFQAALNLNAFFYANFDMPVIKPIVFSKIDFLSLYTVHVIKFANSPQGILQNVYILDKFNSRIYLNVVVYEKYNTVFYIDDATFNSLPDNFTVFFLYGKAMPKPPLITFEIIGDGKVVKSIPNVLTLKVPKNFPNQIKVSWSVPSDITIIDSDYKHIVFVPKAEFKSGLVGSEAHILGYKLYAEINLVT